MLQCITLSIPLSHLFIDAVLSINLSLSLSLSLYPPLSQMLLHRYRTYHSRVLQLYPPLYPSPSFPHLHHTPYRVLSQMLPAKVRRNAVGQPPYINHYSPTTLIIVPLLH